MEKRYVLLDNLRGLALLNMILYHALWDLVYLFDLPIAWYESSGAFIWQQSICWTFILLSGFCWHLGSCKWKRGFWLIGVSVVISMVTICFMPESAILFGVLTLLGTATLLLIPLHKRLQRVNPFIGMLVSFLLFLVMRNVNHGTIGFANWELFALPEAWYQNVFTAYLGFPAADFVSTDYFAVLPWIFLYLTGYYLYLLFQKKKWLRFLTAPRLRPLEWIGRHSLEIYILHQPLIYAILWILFKH